MSEPQPSPAREQTEPLILLQDWTPLGQSLPIVAAGAAWPIEGASLLASRQVPNFTHDSGTLSEQTAQVVLAWCAEQTAAGTLPEQIVVLEAGMGTGLHLRFVLDALQRACQTQGTDWYNRLVVWATDVSEATVRRALARGVFANHADKVRAALLDAAQPDVLLVLDDGSRLATSGQVHVLLGHYLLGTQPVDVFVRKLLDDGERWEVAVARTSLTSPAQLPRYCDLPAQTAVERLQAGDGALAVELAPLLRTETSWQLVELAGHPDAAALRGLADALQDELGPDHDLLQSGTTVNHSAGALQMAQRLSLLLDPSGFALFRDVGVCSAVASALPRGYVAYGSTLAPGVAFWAWDWWFDHGLALPGLQSFVPNKDGVRDHGARLLTRAHLPQTITKFVAAYDGEVLAWPLQVLDQVRTAPEPQQALELLREALVRSPRDWVLLLRAGQLALQLGQLELAVVLCETGLQHNASQSHELWRLRADLLLAQGQPVAALQALHQALHLVPADPVLLVQTAELSLRLGREALALVLIGRALAADPAGLVRQTALQVQAACLLATAPAAKA